MEMMAIIVWEKTYAEWDANSILGVLDGSEKVKKGRWRMEGGVVF